LLPAQGNLVSPKARPNPLHFPTIDAWNLSAQRALTPTLTLTLAYVGNKGTHTLGDGSSNNTDPNESALTLPGQYSINGQTLHWDPNGLDAPLPAGYSGGVKNSNLLKRYYGGSLPACKDPVYVSPLGGGKCGWTNNISYYGDDQNTTFNAMQVTLAKAFTKGLSANVNYQWASAFGQQNGYYTWDVGHHITHLRDSNVRTQSVVVYGSYDLPFGHGKQYAANVNRATDLLIGGFQLSGTMNWAGGLPFSVTYGNFGGTQDCNHNVGGTAAPCRPNAHGKMKTGLSAFKPNSSGKGSRDFWTPQPQVFSFPGLGVIGNAGANTYFGPSFFNTDLAITKAFTIHEQWVAKFRMDAYNAFNHINSGNPNGDIFGTGHITNGAPGQGPRQLTFSARIEF
jgi:hypothetical protein